MKRAGIFSGLFFCPVRPGLKAPAKKEGPEGNLPALLPEVNLCFCALASCLKLHEEPERHERELRNEKQEEENRDFHEEERHQLCHKM